MRKPESSEQTRPGVTAVYLGLGSNMGDRRASLDRAIEMLSQRLDVAEVSPVYDTEPVGNVDQPRFLNLVCKVRTRLAPMGLLTLVKGIESRMGRRDAGHNAPRLIDIDILFFGDKPAGGKGLCPGPAGRYRPRAGTSGEREDRPGDAGRSAEGRAGRPQVGAGQLGVAHVPDIR